MSFRLFKRRPKPRQVSLSSETFTEFLHSHRFVVVHFWAVWNGLDRTMRELLESQLPDDLHETIVLARFDIDPPAHHDICRQHKLLNVPFLAFYRDGVLVRRSTGLLPTKLIAEYFRELANGSSV